MTRRRESLDSAESAGGVNDDFLIAAIRSGDAAALRAFMAKYDRLVRYAIFRSTRDLCQRDLHWLDTVAADTWAAFVQTAQRSPDTLKSAKALLLTIARNRAVSALRGSIRAGLHHPESLPEIEIPESSYAEPGEELVRLEDLTALKECLLKLPSEDQSLAASLEAIMEKRWSEAAGALGVPESTLRSRWKGVLVKLRACLEAKTGRSFAPTRAKKRLNDGRVGLVDRPPDNFGRHKDMTTKASGDSSQKRS